MLLTRTKKAHWMQSFQQGEAAFTEISFHALLRDGVSDTERDVFLAYAVSVFSEEQMMDANLQIIHYQSEFWPQSQNLEESERYFERDNRLRYVERAKTLFLIAKKLLNPDDEAAKIMLKQFKNKVDEDEEKRKKKKDEKIKRQKQKSKFAGGEFTWNELEEAAFGLLKQKTLKFR